MLLKSYSFQDTLTIVIILALCVSVHEFSHAFVLYCFGYNDIRHRLTLNPFVQFPLLSAVLLIFTGFVFGNPVIYNVQWLEEKKNKCLVLFLIKVMGPISNLISAFACLLLLKYVQGSSNAEISVRCFFMDSLSSMAYFNIFFFVYNMLPIPPLDGGSFLQVLCIRIFGSSTVLDLIGIVLVLIIVVCSIFGVSIPFLDNFLYQTPQTIMNWMAQILGFPQ